MTTESVPDRPIDRKVEGATVLIVEDDPILCSTFTDNLRREGISVVGAGDGESGLQLAHANLKKLNLIIIDVRLPG